MARRPQQHERKGTVVSSGPQAGKARRGGTVNLGVQYADTADGRRRPGSLDGVGDDAVVDPAFAFLPEHLRALPADPRDLFAPVEVGVECGDSRHTVRVGVGGVETDSHDVADDVVAALGGEHPACLQFREVFKQGLAVSLELYRDDVVASVREKNVKIGDVRILDARGVADPSAAARELVARASRAGAVQHVARQVADHWLQSLGAAPLEGERGRVWVNRAEEPTLGDVDRLHWRLGTADGKRPVSAYGTFGSREHTRLLLNVNEDWYDDVRENGFLFQGRLSLGTNNEGRVVVDLDPQTGHLYSRLVRDGETLPPFDEVAAQAIESREERTRMCEKQADGKLVIGLFANWEYNDEYYYREGGSNPYGYFESPSDASAWVDFANVHETMFMNQNRPGEYTEYFDEFPAAFRDDPDGDAFDLMNAATNEGVNPVKFAHAFAEWSAVSAARL